MQVTVDARQSIMYADPISFYDTWSLWSFNIGILAFYVPRRYFETFAPHLKDHVQEVLQPAFAWIFAS